MSGRERKSKLKAEDNPTAYGKERRKALRCPLCPPHRHENASKKARPDRHKTDRKGK